jgi:hypothetical protein
LLQPSFEFVQVFCGSRQGEPEALKLYNARIGRKASAAFLVYCGNYRCSQSIALEHPSMAG